MFWGGALFDLVGSRAAYRIFAVVVALSGLAYIYIYIYIYIYMFACLFILTIIYNIGINTLIAYIIILLIK